MFYARRIFTSFVIATVAFALLGAKAKKGDADKKDEAPAVSIKGSKLSPATITIKPGETVTWTNNDDRQHKIVADDGSFKSDDLNHGDAFEHKFVKAGKFKYACSYHPREKGTVVVGDEGKK
ncbi:MAG TPA: cupredoxin domain-containing protein [Tepidisphaeraceae bacterium]|jgi:plastocyanin